MFRDSLNWAAFQKALAVVLEPERGERKLISSTDEDTMPLNMSRTPRPQELHCGPGRVVTGLCTVDGMGCCLCLKGALQEAYPSVIIPWRMHDGSWGASYNSCISNYHPPR